MAIVRLRDAADTLDLGELICTRAEIYQEINGDYVCEIDAPLVDKISPGQIIELADRNGKIQKFRTQRPIETLDGFLIVGEHITADLKQDMILDRGWIMQAGSVVWPELVKAGESNKKFTGVSDIPVVSSTKLVRKLVWDAMVGSDANSFLTRWGGELERDNYTINARKRLGKDSTQTIEYAVNMTGIEIVEDESEIINRIVPTALVGQTGVLSLPEKYIDAPNLSETPVPHMAHIHYGDIRVGEADEDGIILYKTVDDAHVEMRRRVSALYASGVAKPKLSVKVAFVDLASTLEYADVASLMALDLGDTITAKYKGREIRQRIVAYKWDVLREEYIDITLGQIRPSLDSRLARINQELLDEADYRTLIHTYKPMVDYINLMNEQVAQAVGMYRTERVIETGGTVVYFHDQPNLEDSMLIEYYPEPGTRVWTQDGWNNGDPLWQYGQTSSGMLIMRLIAVEGIQAEWIKLDSGQTLEERISEIESVVTGKIYTDFPTPPYSAGDLIAIPPLTHEYWSQYTHAQITAMGLTHGDMQGGRTYLIMRDRTTGSFNRSDVELVGEDGQAVAEVLTTIKEHAAELTKLGLRATETERQVNSLGQQIGSTTTRIGEYEAAQAQLTTVVDGVQQTQATLKSDVLAMTGRIDDAEGNIATLTKDALTLSGRVGATEGNIATITKDAATLTTKVNGQDTKIGKLESSALTMETRIGGNTDTISQLTSDALALKGRVDGHDGSIATLTSDALAMSKTVTAVSGTANTALSKADQALLDAAKKTTTYTSRPSPPYSAGELWAEPKRTHAYWSSYTHAQITAWGLTHEVMAGGLMLMCKTSRSTGAFTLADWVVVGTDSTQLEAFQAQYQADMIKMTKTVDGALTGLTEIKAGYANFVKYDDLNKPSSTVIDGGNIDTGIIRGNNAEFNLDAGVFQSTSADRTIRFSNGELRLLKGTDEKLFLSNSYNTHDVHLSVGNMTRSLIIGRSRTPDVIDHTFVEFRGAEIDSVFRRPVTIDSTFKVTTKLVELGDMILVDNYSGKTGFRVRGGNFALQVTTNGAVQVVNVTTGVVVTTLFAGVSA